MTNFSCHLRIDEYGMSETCGEDTFGYGPYSLNGKKVSEEEYMRAKAEFYLGQISVLDKRILELQKERNRLERWRKYI